MRLTAAILLALISVSSTGCSRADAARGVFGPKRAVLGTPFQNAVLALSVQPTAWWYMDEASGNLTDHAGSRTATANGTPLYHQTTIVVGDTFSINSNNSGYFTFSSIVLSGDYTIILWFKSPAGTGDVNLTFFGGSIVADTAMVGMFNSNIRVIGDDGATFIAADHAIAGNTPTFMVFRRAGSTVTIYEDNVDRTSGTGVTTATVTLSIMLNSHLSGTNVTTMQEAAIWQGTSLSNTEVTSLYNAGH